MVADLTAQTQEPPANGADSQPVDGQAPATPDKPKSPYTALILRRTRPQIYKQVAHLLSEGVSNRRIQRICRVTQESVKAVWKREAEAINERKNRIVANLSDVAELGSERMTETIGKAGIRDAAIGTGVAIDKILALTGQTPPSVGVVIMPSETQRAETRSLDAKLDEIARRLRAQAPTLTLPEQ